MYQREATVKSKIGLHARPASMLVKAASSYKCKVTLQYKGKQVEAKSMLAVLAAGIRHGEVVTVIADGEDAENAVNRLVEMIENTED